MYDNTRDYITDLVWGLEKKEAINVLETQITKIKSMPLHDTNLVMALESALVKFQEN